MNGAGEGAEEGADLPYRALRNLRNAAWALPGPYVEPMVGLWAEQFNTFVGYIKEEWLTDFIINSFYFLMTIKIIALMPYFGIYLLLFGLLIY